MVRVRKSPTPVVAASAHRTGFTVELVFQITQHTRDELLLASFKNYFACGIYRERIGGLAGDFYVGKLSDLHKKIIPFFSKYLIIGVKAKDFEDLTKVAWLMQSKAHLTPEGLEQIRIIKAGMNRAR